MERQSLHVLVVDDSAVVREVMTAVLSQESGITVAVAADPFIAMAKIRQQRPDAIILDIEMPRMDGLTFLKKIVREDPIPVVICSALTGPGTAVGIQALEEGAVEVVTKPRLAVRQFLHESAVILIDAVRAAAGSRAKPRQMIERPSTRRPNADAVLTSHAQFAGGKNTETLIAIGASTGGTEALRVVLEAMPLDAPGMVVVQHMPEGFTKAFAQRLNQTCAIEVREAVNGDPLTAGLALVAPGNRHSLLVRDGTRYTVEVSDGPLVSRHRPSVDVLFRSVAQAAGANAIGIILTGMGSDGAEGLLEMKRAGALTVAQDESSCVVFGMPKEAIERGAVDKVVSLSRIPHEILSAGLQKQWSRGARG
ncbi:MAG TPA: chemotaxis response regulator protein-glutamate methylesterase [Candidatus Binatia bacterium]|jgi:two-component system chemotaxis response regulator CheB